MAELEGFWPCIIHDGAGYGRTQSIDCSENYFRDHFGQTKQLRF